MLKGLATKEAAYFETFGLSLWKVSSLLPVGRGSAQRLASPALNGSLHSCLLKQALGRGLFSLRNMSAICVRYSLAIEEFAAS